MVQVLVLAFILDLFQNFRRCAFSERRRFRPLRRAHGNFVKSQQDMPAQSFGDVHKGRIYVHCGECMRAYISAIVCTVLKTKIHTAMHNVGTDDVHLWLLHGLTDLTYPISFVPSLFCTQEMT